MKKNKDQREFEKFARGIITEYRAKLLLDRHTVDIVQDNDSSYMSTSFRPPYLDNEIRYNPDKVLRDWRNGKRDELKHCLVHELFHVVTDFFYGEACDRYATKDAINHARETLTDHLAAIVKHNGI